MKGALVVLLAGLLLLAGAVAGVKGGAGSLPPPSADERGAAIEAVRTFLSLTAHYRSVGGDPRFLERLPAVPQLVDEIGREHEFATHLGAKEEGKTIRLDVAEVRRPDPERLEVDTTEYRTTWITIPGAAAAAHSDVIRARYEVVRLPGGWTVVDRLYAPLMIAPAGGE